MMFQDYLLEEIDVDFLSKMRFELSLPKTYHMSPSTGRVSRYTTKSAYLVVLLSAEWACRSCLISS